MSEEPTTDGIEKKVEEAIASPSSFSIDGLSQSNRSIAEIISADRYLSGKKSRSGVGFRVQRMIPPEP